MEDNAVSQPLSENTAVRQFRALVRHGDHTLMWIRKCCPVNRVLSEAVSIWRASGQQLCTLTVKDLCWKRNQREQNEYLASPTPFRHQSSCPTPGGAPARRVHRN